jgi:hypothetical protein
VAFLAFLLRMFAGQRKARLGEMAELLTVQDNQRRALPFMFFVTAPAVGFAGQALVVIRVKPGVGLHPAPDFDVTLETLEAARAGSKRVAGPAFGESVQLLVGA